MPRRGINRRRQVCYAQDNVDYSHLNLRKRQSKHRWITLFFGTKCKPEKSSLPHFYFDFDDGRSRFRDEEGIDLPDVEGARTEVLKALSEIAKDALPRSDRQAFHASVRNASGSVVYSAKVTVSGGWHEA